MTELPPEDREQAEALARLFADEPDPIKRYGLIRDAVRDYQQDLKLRHRRGELVGNTVDLVAQFEHHLWRTLSERIDEMKRSRGTA